jgi:hypothetical protein
MSLTPSLADFELLPVHKPANVVFVPQKHQGCCEYSPPHKSLGPAEKKKEDRHRQGTA